MIHLVAAISTLFLGLSGGISLGTSAFAEDPAAVRSTALPESLKDIGIDDKLGAQIPVKDIQLFDENGQQKPLASFFHPERPVLLSLVYYECPNLCNLVLNGLVDGLKNLDWEAGKKFDIITLSIDPKEKSDLAKRKKEAYLKSLGKPGFEQSWHFLTGSEENIKKLSHSVGFKFKWDDTEKQFAHGAALFVVTPDGRLSRTLYGIQYSPTNLKLSLLEASSGKIGTIIDRILLFCYRYNPITRTYSIVATKLMQIGGLLTLIVLGTYLGLFWLTQRKRGSEGQL